MKKLLLTEGLIACFFLALLLGLFGKYLGRERESQKTNASVYEEEKRKKGTIWIYPGSMSESFSPLQYESQGEKNVLMMCFENLLSRDANGVRNNKEVTQQWEKGDEELAHISVSYDEKKKLSSVTIQLNPNKRTVSGKKIDADDLLFNFYLRCDASGGEGEPLGDVQILGQEEYTYGSSQVEKRKKEIQKNLSKPSKETQKKLQEEIVSPELKEELQWVKSLYQDDAYDFISSKYKEPKDLFAYYYAYQTKYSSEGKTEQQVFDDIVSQYSWHYDWLGKVTNESYTKKAQKIALSVLLQQKGKDTVKQITGIQKKDDQTVVIQVIGKEDCVEPLCDFWLLPIDEYGSRERFDGKQNFGFEKGKAEEILEESFEKYQATGAYYAKKIEKNKIILVRNPYYSGKKANIKKIRIVRKDYSENTEIVEDLLCQRVDIVITRESEELSQLIQSRATHASYLIREKEIQTSQEENCLLYRTSYVNAPSIPEKLTEYQMIFQGINRLKVNG